MGNLAERYADPKRSGLYRVSSPVVPALAAREAGADLRECDATEVESELDRLSRLAGKPQGRPCILLVHGISDWIEMSASDGTLLTRRLQSALQRLRPRVDPCFVVLIDPFKTLPLPSLWREPSPPAAARSDRSDATT